MPLPPRSSRAHATVSRHLAVQNALASAACASVSLPSACSCACRVIRHCDAVMLAIILARRSCTRLERPDRLAELQALLAVLDGGLVSAHRASGRHPCDGVARHLQHLRGVAERVAALQPVRFRHTDVPQRDVAVLDDLEGDLVFDLLDTEARRRFVFDDEALDLVIGEITRPDDRNIAPWRIADPPLLAVEDPGVAFALRRCRQPAGGAGTDQRLGEAKAADLVQACHRRQPFLLLVLRSVDVDRAHCRPLWTPMNVENDGSTRAISIWTKPSNAKLPPTQP